MANIFISYRREDSAYPADQIYTALINHYGEDSIVFDIDTIPLGVDFRNHIIKEISKCDIFLTIIGDKWLDILRERMHDPDDYVRLEIQTALEKKVPIIPILVDNATVPKEENLPTEIVKLAYQNGTEVRAGPDLHNHLKRLINKLDKLLSVEKKEITKKKSLKFRISFIAIFLIAALIAIFWIPIKPKIPDVRTAIREIPIRSIDQMITQRAEITNVSPGNPDGSFEVIIEPNPNAKKNKNPNLHWSWGRVMTHQNISTHFFATIKLTRGQGIKTVELTGHGFFFVVDYVNKKYWMWHSNKKEESTNDLQLLSTVDLNINTLGIHQLGRKVNVFFNAKFLDSFKLVDEPTSGPVGLYFKTDPDLGGQVSFQRFNIWEF